MKVYESLTAGLLRNSWPYDRKAVVTCQSDRIIIHPSPRLWATQLFPTVSKFLKRKERLLVVGGFYALSRAPTDSAFNAPSSFGLSLRAVQPSNRNRSPFASFRAWGRPTLALLQLRYQATSVQTPDSRFHSQPQEHRHTPDTRRNRLWRKPQTSSKLLISQLWPPLELGSLRGRIQSNSIDADSASDSKPEGPRAQRALLRSFRQGCSTRKYMNVWPYHELFLRNKLTPRLGPKRASRSTRNSAGGPNFTANSPNS